MFHNNKNNIIAVVVVVLVLVVGLYFKSAKQGGSEYSVVYLSTGEEYAGKLTTFPNFQLKNAYLLTTVPDATDPKKSNFQLNPINEALWATAKMNLIKDNVVFYAPLLETSSIAK